MTDETLEEALEQMAAEGDKALIDLTEAMHRDRVMGFLTGAKRDPIYQSIERMKKNFYHLWLVLHELYLSPYADPTLLEGWRQAPEGSQEWRKARQHDEAVELLLIAVKGR